MRIFSAALILVSSLSVTAFAEEAESEPEAVEVSRGTRLYDAESVKELFVSYKKENEERAAAASNTDGFEDMEIFDMKEMEVRANRLGVNERALLEKLDPQPQNRIRRLSRINPEAAFDIQTAARNDEVFFSSSNDGANVNTGSTANLSVTQMADALEATFNNIGKLFGSKKKTGDGR